MRIVLSSIFTPSGNKESNKVHYICVTEAVNVGPTAVKLQRTGIMKVITTEFRRK